MSIFEQLYNGEIYIAQNCVPNTNEYKKAARALSEASEKLEALLDEKQLKILEVFQAARADAESLIQIKIYSQGIMFG
ncbi:MAG: hypothetical protein RR444_09510, partial [Oscillospiraceae bacterium]